jgi:Helix-turn-helix domain
LRNWDAQVVVAKTFYAHDSGYWTVTRGVGDRILESDGNAHRSGKNLDGPRVSSLRRVHGIQAYRSAEKNGEWLTMRDAAKLLGVSNHAIRRLIKNGVLAAEQVVPDAPYQNTGELHRDRPVLQHGGERHRPRGFEILPVRLSRRGEALAPENAVLTIDNGGDMQILMRFDTANDAMTGNFLTDFHIGSSWFDHEVLPRRCM